MGLLKTPVSNVLLTFSTIFVENSKLPCVNPPPSTTCNPTKSGENDWSALGGAGG